MTTKRLLILFVFTGFFTLDEISNKAQANQAPEDIYNLTEQDIQNTKEHRAMDIEEARSHIIDVCQEEYITQDPTVYFEEKTEDMLDCLSLRTQQKLRPHQEEEHFLNGLKIHFQAIDDQYTGEVEFDTVVPIAETADHPALFLQPGFILSIKDTGDPKNLFSGSLGVVYRFVFHQGVLGFNVFYDRQRGLNSGSIYQHRLGLGTDYQSGKNMFSLNHYQPLQGWKDFNEFYEERARQGIDFRWRRLFSKRLAGQGQLAYWDAETGQDEFLSSVGVDYKLSCASALGLEMERNFDSHQTTTRLTYKVLLGVPPHQQGRNCMQEQYENETKGLLYRLVQREKKIRVERRRKAPALVIPDQYIESGKFFSYNISRANFRFVKSEETPDILITSLPNWIDYDPTSMRFSGATLKMGTWTVKGRVALPGIKNSNLWSFNIIVSDNSTPVMLTEDQIIPRGEKLNYQPVLKNDPDHEDVFITTNKVATHSPTLTWFNQQRLFEIDSEESSSGKYVVTGSIRDEDDNSSNWAFKVTVTPTDLSDFIPPAIEDNQAPLLRAEDQIIRQNKTRYMTPVISRLRLGEQFTVTVDAVSVNSPSVTYSATNNQFKINTLSARLGEHVVTGSIGDENNNSSNWAFKVTVIGENDPNPDDPNPDDPNPENPNPENPNPENTENDDENTNNDIEDTSAPILLAEDQTVSLGSRLNYAPVIDNLRYGENFMVHVQPTSTGAPAVSWNETNNQFMINAETAVLGVYTVIGSISDENDNSSSWSFKITVTDSESSDTAIKSRAQNPEDEEEDSLVPILQAEDQIIKIGESLHHTPSISNLNPGESFMVHVQPTSTGAPAISWDETNNQFMINAETAVLGVYTAIGSISDENDNSSNWAFKVTVVPESIILPPREDSKIIIGNPIIIAPPSDDLPTDKPPTENPPQDDPPQENPPTENPPQENPPQENPPTENPPQENPPQENPPTENPPQDDPPQENPPTENPPQENPPQENPPTENPPQENPPQDSNSAPTLTAENQTVEIGRTLNYSPTIGNLQSGEAYTVQVSQVPTGAPAVSWDETNSQFKINAQSANLGTHSISGTIKDANNNSNTWSFNINVVDTNAPTLTAQNQTVEIEQTLNYSPTIGNLRSGEAYTVQVNQVPTGAPAVSWDETNSRFKINAQSANLGTHSISGTIKDANNNSNTWSFNINVVDTNAPTLTAQNQTVEINKSITSTPTISNLRSGEGYTVQVSSITPSAQKPTVSWDSTNKRFSITAGESVKNYTISGTIQDDSGNSSSWSFTITVTDRADTDAPTLRAQNQTVEIGRTLNYPPAIGNLRSGEAYTVQVGQILTGAPAVSWDATNSRFKINAQSAHLGTHSISGTIKDASNNSNTWSFNITVVDTNAPTLTAQNQTVEIGRTLNYPPAIGNLRSGEAYTVQVGQILTGAPAVSWDATNSRFKINAQSANLGTHSISGTIKDANNNSNTWSFNITVVDTNAPTLTAQNRTAEINESITSTPTISNLRSGEGYTVQVSSITPSAQKPTVSWDSTNKRFSITAGDSVKNYTVSGTIQDDSGNSSSWSFTITVTSATIPTLQVSNKTMRIQKKIYHSSYSLGGVRADQSFTVTIDSISPSSAQSPAVIWDGANNRFVIRSGSKAGVYTVSGKIRKRRNFSSWSFTITVTLNN